jgi:hypothetical protein
MYLGRCKRTTASVLHSPAIMEGLLQGCRSFATETRGVKLALDWHGTWTEVESLPHLHVCGLAYIEETGLLRSKC